MQSIFKNKIQFFHDCYERESQAKYLWNIFDEPSEHRCEVPSGSDQKPSNIAITGSKLEKLKKLSEFYQRDKQLYLCSHVLISKYESNSFGRAQEKRVCCPLVYYPVTIVSSNWDGLEQFKPDFDNPKLNPAAKVLLFSLLKTATPELNTILNNEQLLLQSILQQDPFEEKSEAIQESNKADALYRSGYSIRPHLKKSFELNGISLHPLAMVSRRFINKTIDDSKNTVYYNWGNWLCLCDKLEGAHSVLYELQELQQSPATSEPLAQMLKLQLDQEPENRVRKNKAIKKASNKYPEVPAILSDQQQQALLSSQHEKLSLVMGPPGTGKSFTIACMALAAYMRGESVLVVSQNHHAVSVVRNKLISHFGIDSSVTTIGSDKGMSHELAKELATPLADQYETDLKSTLKEIEKELKDTLDMLDIFETNFRARCDYEVDRDVNPDSKPFIPPSTPTGFKRLFSFLRKDKFIPAHAKFLTQDLEVIEELDKKSHDLIVKRLNALNALTKIKAYNNWDTVASIDNFRSSLFQHSAQMQDEYNKNVDYETLLEVLPLWFAPITNLSHLLPLKADLFDLVIIDEATQCNMAVSMPAIHRAKKAVVVGDPKQLSHVSFVSKQDQERLHKTLGLADSNLDKNYRDNSLIDYVKPVLGSSQVTLLDEHYRSHPQIINFSNHHFYDGSLKIMTEKPGDDEDAIEIIQVEGTRVNGLNKAEADKIMTDLRELVDGQIHIPGREAHSIGILSFFNKQTKILEKLIFEKFTINEIRKHDIHIGTPFKFQGEERDVMFISCCIDADTKSGSYAYLNRDDVFNVSITRARDSQKIYLSCAPDAIKSSSLLSQYIRYCETYTEQQRKLKKSANSLRDDFQESVVKRLTQEGLSCHKNFRIAGKSLDIIAVHDNKCLAIDLVGYLGTLRDVLPLKRFKLLYRAGLPSFLLPYNEWHKDEDQIIEMIRARLDIDQSVIDDNSEQTASYKTVADVDEQEFQDLFATSMQSLIIKFSQHGKPRGSNQVYLLIKKYRQYLKVLNQKFKPNEITYQRYKDAYLLVIKHSIRNLKQTLATLDLLNSLLEQEQTYALLPEEDQYEGMHDERVELIQEQQSHLHALMLENESALHQMDKTTIRLNQLQTTPSGTTNIKEAEAMLKEMTDRLHKYSSE